MDYEGVEKHLLARLGKELPDALPYHGLHHTLAVVEAAERIARDEGVTGEELTLVKTAALFHDSGFLFRYADNEELGARLAAELLPAFGYSPEQIGVVEGMVAATRLPQRPATRLEAIVCDADLDYLGSDDYHAVAATFRQELAAHGRELSDDAWAALQREFLGRHRFHTASSRRRNAAKLAARLEELEPHSHT